MEAASCIIREPALTQTAFEIRKGVASMYYSNGNYEGHARPRKPAGADKKHAYIIGAGLAGLSTAVFLVRDAQVPGKQIHILEELPLAGGSLDGAMRPGVGYVVRGGREMENHFECMWDMYSSIPSLEIPGASYLDEYYWLDKDDPNSSNCRLIYNRGNQVPSDGEYQLGKHAQELVKLIMTPEDQLVGKTIEDWFSPEFFATNFWTYWATMFAFEKWHSLIEMRRYAMRFIHHIDGLPDFTALKFNKYNQYESMTKPLLAYLKDHGVVFDYDTEVKNVKVAFKGKEKHATALELVQGGEAKTVPLTDDDLVFVTNGSITESTTYGSHHQAAPISHELGGSWKLWEKLADQSTEFGNPDAFCKTIPDRAWFVSATATIKNPQIEPYIERLTKRDLHDHKVNTGGIITVTDSNWELSWTIHRQPHFKDQAENETVVWIYGLFSDTEGNYVHKRIVDCTGEEITKEWLYHLGVPESLIADYAKEESVQTVPVYMPFITAYFQLRKPGDRPAVVPNGSANLAFIGNFAESPSRDTVFTTEYSVRTAMEAVYTLMKVDRGVPEVFNSVYDIRELMRAMYYMADKKPLAEQDLPIPKALRKPLLKKIEGSWLGELMKDAHLL